MRVALEEALLEDHARVDATDPARDFAEVVTGSGEPLDVGHLDAVEVLEDEKLAGRVLGVNARDDDGRVAGERGADALGRHGLELEVELERDELADLLHDGGEVEVADQAPCGADDDAERS